MEHDEANVIDGSSHSRLVSRTVGEDGSLRFGSSDRPLIPLSCP